MKIITKTDPERSTKQLQDDLREMNPHMITMPENSNAGDSASNGLVERAVQEAEGYIRSLLLDLELLAERPDVGGPLAVEACEDREADGVGHAGEQIDGALQRQRVGTIHDDINI